MLIFLWAYVMMTAMPGGAQLAQHHADFVQNQMRANLPAARTAAARIPPATLPRGGVAIGAASAFTR